MHPDVTLTYPCGHTVSWPFDDLDRAQAETEQSCCPLCVGPCLDLEDLERVEEV